MEEMHRIHKEVPFGYWVLWVEPAFKALRRRWRQRRERTHREHDRVLAMR
jgi:hypothetical protein